MPPSYFPLRWESTGEQWWYASPIDWAAANGLYDVVRELLYLDNNLLIKLTSLRRIRRLETVWDDQSQFEDVAKCRCEVAKNLLYECDSNKTQNSLIRARYGGWLLYTAASAGDENFVKELLARHPFLAFGEGEYGVTDILYAAARSKNCELFRFLFEFAVSSPRGFMRSGEELDGDTELEEKSSDFKWEMRNRAVHACARAGNLEMLKKLLGDCSDVLIYRDAQGFSLLHTAAGRGQIEVVKDLITSFEVITSKDNQGNTALHVAAYRGYLAVVEVLILVCPVLASLTNNNGDTFLHMAVSGFRFPGFRKVDQQIELMNQLRSGKILNIQDIINNRNKDGRTAFHMAVLENMQSSVAELLMTVPSIDLNIRDVDGMTALDLLRQQPRSASSEVLIKQLVLAGATFSCQHQVRERKSASVTHLRVQGIGSSPGTSFRIPDSDIFSFTGMEIESDASCSPASPEYASFRSDISELDSAISLNSKRSGSVSRLKFLLWWPRKKGRKSGYAELGDTESFKSLDASNFLQDNPVSLRQRYSKCFSPPSNKSSSFRSKFPSPSTKRQFAAGLMHGVIQSKPHLGIPFQSPSSPFQESAIFSSSPANKQKGIGVSGPACSNQSFSGEGTQVNNKQTSFNKKLMNRYFCFGAQHVAVEDSLAYTGSYLGHRSLSSLVA